MKQEIVSTAVSKIRRIFRKFCADFIKVDVKKKLSVSRIERLNPFVKRVFLQLILTELLEYLKITESLRKQVKICTFEDFVKRVKQEKYWRVADLSRDFTKLRELIDVSKDFSSICRKLRLCIREAGVSSSDDGLYFYVYAFESLIEFEIEQCQLSKSLGLQVSDSRKKSGAFYTPKTLVEFTVKSAFQNISNSGTKLKYEKLKICDPALGGGLFLVECAKYMYENADIEDEAPQFYKKLIENNLFGVDKNPLAVEVSKIVFKLMCFPVEIDSKLIDAQIKVGDSLIGIMQNKLQTYVPAQKYGKFYLKKRTSEPDSVYTCTQLENWCNLWFMLADKNELISELVSFDEDLEKHSKKSKLRESVFIWECEFPEVFSGKKPGFDIIISNPPYRSFYSRHSGKNSDQSKLFERFAGACLSEIEGFQAVTERINYFLLFIVRATELLKDKGVSAFVLPDTILMNEGYQKMRFALLKTKMLKEASYFKHMQFRGATVGTSVITWQMGNTNTKIKLKSIDEKCEKQEQFLRSQLLKRQFQSILYAPEIKVYNSKLFVPLSRIAHVKDGINPGKKTMRDLLITSSDGDNAQKLIEGSNIDKFSISWQGKYVIYDEKLITRKHKLEGTSLRKSWIFDSPKIVYRQTSPEIVAAVDLHSHYALNSVQCIILKKPDEQHLFALCAYLNSDYLRMVYQDLSGETRKTYPQVHISAVKKLPIPRRLLSDESIQSQLAENARKLSKNSDIKAKNGILFSEIQEQLTLENDILIKALTSDEE